MLHFFHIPLPNPSLHFFYYTSQSTAFGEIQYHWYRNSQLWRSCFLPAKPCCTENLLHSYWKLVCSEVLSSFNWYYISLCSTARESHHTEKRIQNITRSAKNFSHLQLLGIIPELAPLWSFSARHKTLPWSWPQFSYETSFPNLLPTWLRRVMGSQLCHY